MKLKIVTLKEYEKELLEKFPDLDDDLSEVQISNKLSWRIATTLKHYEKLAELCQEIKDSTHTPYELIDKLVTMACNHRRRT